MSWRTVIGLAVLLASGCAQAQTMPNTAQLDAEQARIDADRRQMFDAGNPAAKPRVGQQPAAAAIKREMVRIEGERKAMFDANNPDTRNAPNLFPNVSAPEVSNIDIEAIARQYEKKVAARKMDDLMIFASFTMPAESLKRIVTQANRIGAAVVFRGFKNSSWKDTALAIKALDANSGNVLVNPKAFDKYKIDAVPAVVLLKAEGIGQVDNEGCALPDKFVSLAGDVSLEFALEEIARRSSSFEPMASQYLRQVRGQH